jgi:hypothetical protein
MKETKLVRSTLLLLASGLLSLTLQAQPIVAGHYPVGAEGIKGGSLPPPGVYFRDYNFFYFADNFKDGPPQFDIFAYINAPRLIWIGKSMGHGTAILAWVTFKSSLCCFRGIFNSLIWPVVTQCGRRRETSAPAAQI